MPIIKKDVKTTSHFHVERKKFEIISDSNKVDKEKSVVTGKKFNITRETDGYRPSEKVMPVFSKFQCADFRGNLKTHELYIEQQAIDMIFDHIEWGEKTNQNIVEQGGLLLGHVYKDVIKNVVWGIVTNAVAAKAAKGSGAHLEMGHYAWKTMIDHIDNLSDSFQENKIQVIGWYHTHPNSLDVFMSGTDRDTQRKMFFNDWQFAIVINPHQQKWRVFHGENAEECAGYIIENGDEKKHVELDEVQDGDSKNNVDETINQHKLTFFLGGILFATIIFSVGIISYSFVTDKFSRNNGKATVNKGKNISKWDKPKSDLPLHGFKKLPSFFDDCCMEQNICTEQKDLYRFYQLFNLQNLQRNTSSEILEKGRSNNFLSKNHINDDKNISSEIIATLGAVKSDMFSAFCFQNFSSVRSDNKDADIFFDIKENIYFLYSPDHKNDRRRKTRFSGTENKYIKIKQGDNVELKTESGQRVRLYIATINNKNGGAVQFKYKIIDNQ